MNPDLIGALFLGAFALLLAVWSLHKLGRWSDDRTYGPRLIYGPTDPIAADESVAAVSGWDDPFIQTRRQIAALGTYQEPA